MLESKCKQLSLYSILYDRIPKNHILRLINEAVDFSFINKLLEDSYCRYYGRPAKEPEMMAKFLILQYLYTLSDIRVIEETAVNLAYMWFVGINPEDGLPDPSLLAKFRTQRLKETSLDDIIMEVVRQCVDKRIMKHLSAKILKNLKEENGSIPETVDGNIPDYKEIEDHKEAKATMKNYLEKLIENVEDSVDKTKVPRTEAIMEKAKEILDDPKFLQQKGIRSLVDEDARVGYKSKTDSFYGYKIEFAMVPEERIITAVVARDGAYVDGTEFEWLYNQTKECGIEIKEAYGDKAYFRKTILDILAKDKVEAIIPVSETVYKVDESKYSYNKDSDQWFCDCGNRTVSKKPVTRKDGRQFLEYRFDKETCRNCPKRKECFTGTAIANKLTLGLNTTEFYEYSQYSKTEEFKERYKKRASHEWKNGEMKRFHGLARTKGYGLKSMLTQAKLTALAVNLKRIAKILSSISDTICNYAVINITIIMKTEKLVPRLN